MRRHRDVEDEMLRTADQSWPGAGSPPRVMWLLNHTSARAFEIPMLKRLGIREIFLPKRYPNDPNFRSASIDHTEDRFLTIPEADLERLNACDWYGDPGPDAWELASRHFDIAFFILFRPECVARIAQSFRGAALWRTYGIAGDMTYSRVLREMIQFRDCGFQLRSLGRRFWFAEAYPHLHEVEDEFLARRSVWLPLGMHNPTLPGAESRARANEWRGDRKAIFFVCPDIGFNAAYEQIHRQFVEDFPGFPFVVGGAQAVPVADPRVLGYVSRSEHEENMRALRLMYYHSREPNHVHFHPFEAVRAGMPLLFMAGGMLDAMGGRQLPGRCGSAEEARRKARRILDDDWAFIDRIRESQGVLLEAMREENCIDAWRAGMKRIGACLAESRVTTLPLTPRPRRVAVLLPVADRRVSPRKAVAVAAAIVAGAGRMNQQVEVVLGHVEDANYFPASAFGPCPESIKRRTFRWKVVGREVAGRALAYAGRDQCLDRERYQVPDDGMRQFADCDLWVLMSEATEESILPLRPYVLVLSEGMRAAEGDLPAQALETNLVVAQRAARVLVSSDHARGTAIQCLGLPAERLTQLPRLRVGRPMDASACTGPWPGHEFFLWVPDWSRSDRVAVQMAGLRRYYETQRGRLKCVLTGLPPAPPPDQLALLRGLGPHLRHVRSLECEADDLSDGIVAAAAYVWVGGITDDSVAMALTAADAGVRLLADPHPLLEELAAKVGCEFSWTAGSDAVALARDLQHMEAIAGAGRSAADDGCHGSFVAADDEQAAAGYWEAIRQCL